jgi:hypothetical protein
MYVYEIIRNKGEIDIVGGICMEFDNYKSLITERKLEDEFVILVLDRKSDNYFSLSIEDANKICNKEKYKDVLENRIKGYTENINIIEKINSFRSKLENIELKDNNIDGCIIVKYGDIKNTDDEFISSIRANDEEYIVLFGDISLKYKRIKDNSFDFKNLIGEETTKLINAKCRYCKNKREYDEIYDFMVKEYKLCSKCIHDIRATCIKINDNKEAKQELITKQLLEN